MAPCRHRDPRTPASRAEAERPHAPAWAPPAGPCPVPATRLANTLGEHPGRSATAREVTHSDTPGPEAPARPRRLVNLSSRRKVTWSPGHGPPGTDWRPGHPHRFCPLHPAQGRSPGLSPTGVRVDCAPGLRAPCPHAALGDEATLHPRSCFCSQSLWSAGAPASLPPQVLTPAEPPGWPHPPEAPRSPGTVRIPTVWVLPLPPRRITHQARGRRKPAMSGGEKIKNVS